MAAELSIIQTMIALPLKMPSVFEHFGIEPPKGVLLYGPPGTGKTLIARVLANVLDVKFFVINGPEIVSKYFGESEEKLRDLFSQASLCSPSLIFIDELDSLAPKRDEEINSSSKRIVGTLLTLMDGIKKDQRVIVLAATNRPNSIDSALRRPGRFDREIEIGIPSVPDRHSILKLYLSNMKHNLSDSDIHLLAQSTHGYVGADLHQLCKQAALSSLHRHLPPLEMDNLERLQENLKIMEEQLGKEEVVVEKGDFSRAVSEVRPSAMREILVELPKVEWREIGGYEFVKQKLREAVEWPLKYPQKFEEFGIRPPRGILLYGPPGCSKTLMAKALASESKLNFIPVKGPELFSKYVGDSERAVREVFRRARMASPSIVFFDEIDAIAVARGMSGDGNTVGDRVLSQLLNELDGITPLNDVLLLAATNRPDIIDKALMRPGRIDNILYIPPPDQDARLRILQIHTAKMKLSDGVDLNALAGKTEKYSGAEIAQVCREAAMTALRRDLNADAVGSADFEEALKIILPRTTSEQLDFYSQFAKSVTL
uniref:AAA+ ATPase domain-containing protein n=1 Tax=Arcella intermedia TaxID=1963864 RepID=A0A6B2L1D6_9EUKA